MVVMAFNENGDIVQEERYTQAIFRQNDLTLDNFLKQKRLEGCTDETLRSYHDYVVSLSTGVGKRFIDMTSTDIKSFLSNYQTTRHISNQSLDNMRRCYSSFFNYMEEEYDKINPTKKIHKIKSETTIQYPFTDEDIVLLRDNCANIRELAIVDFLNSSGVRVSELVGLNKTDISLISREGVVFGKGRKERRIYFDAAAKIHIQKYLQRRKDNNPALFVTAREPYERLTKAGVEYMIAKLGMRSNVEKCHPHRFRRSLATRLIDRNVPIEQVQSILGHTKIETTLIYAQVNQNNVKINHSKFCG